MLCSSNKGKLQIVSMLLLVHVQQHSNNGKVTFLIILRTYKLTDQ